MKLQEMKLENFRGYGRECHLLFDDLTVLVGRNDAGKSSLLDALDIFFNDAQTEKEDGSVHGDSSCVRITCVFNDLPSSTLLIVTTNRHNRRSTIRRFKNGRNVEIVRLCIPKREN